MNLRTHRLFHHLAISFALTGCTIERIDLGGIDTIGGQLSTDSTHHTPSTTSASTTWVETEAPDSVCLAYKEDGETKLIPCSETTSAVAAGYCVIQHPELPNQPAVCPGTPPPPLEPSSTATTEYGSTVTTPSATTTANETCTYIVENGSTVAVTCNTPTGNTSGSETCTYVDGSTAGIGCVTTVPQPSCATVDDADQLIPVPCDEPEPTCAIIDSVGNVVPVPCEGTTTVPSCSGTIVTGETPPPCDPTGETTTSPATTVLPSSDAPPLAPPPDDTDDTDEQESSTNEPNLVDAGAAPNLVDTAAP